MHDRVGDRRRRPTAAGCAGPSTAPQRRAAFVAAGVAARRRVRPGRERRADRRRRRRQPHRPLPLLPDKDDLRQAIADEIVGRVIASVLPHLVLDAESTPRDVITRTIVDDHRLVRRAPELLRVPARPPQRPSLGAVETTLADRVAYLLQGLMMFFGIDDDQAEPGAYGIVGFVESSCAWWLAPRPAGHDVARAVHRAASATAVWHLLDGIARANGIADRLRRPAAVRGARPAHGIEGLMTATTTATTARPS